MSTETSPKPPPKPAGELMVEREMRNPWLRWMVHFGGPVGISIVVHMFLFGALGLSTFVAVRAGAVDVGEFDAGIAEIDETDSDFTFPDDEMETPDEPELDQLENLDDLMTEIDTSDLSNDDGLDDDLGFGGSGRGDILGIGSGAGGAGEGGFGSGLGGGRRIGGRVGMWGENIIANKIAYVIDFSGSVVIAQDDLVRELKKSIGGLRPHQSFNVHVFYGPTSKRVKTDSFKDGLVSANRENKTAFFKWINSKAPMGATEPQTALIRALGNNPEAVFFLSDGYFDNKIVDQITRANHRGGRVRARIYCFVFDDVILEDTSGLPRETDGVKRLRRLANSNNGKVKIVTGRDLGGP